MLDIVRSPLQFHGVNGDVKKDRLFDDDSEAINCPVLTIDGKRSLLRPLLLYFFCLV